MRGSRAEQAQRLRGLDVAGHQHEDRALSAAPRGQARLSASGWSSQQHHVAVPQLATCARYPSPPGRAERRSRYRLRQRFGDLVARLSAGVSSRTRRARAAPPSAPAGRPRCRSCGPWKRRCGERTGRTRSASPSACSIVQRRLHLTRQLLRPPWAWATRRQPAREQRVVQRVRRRVSAWLTAGCDGPAARRRGSRCARRYRREQPHTKALLQSGVLVGGYQGAPVSHLLDVMVQASELPRTRWACTSRPAQRGLGAAMLGASHYPVRGAVTLEEPSSAPTWPPMR